VPHLDLRPIDSNAAAGARWCSHLLTGEGLDEDLHGWVYWFLTFSTAVDVPSRRVTMGGMEAWQEAMGYELFGEGKRKKEKGND